MPEYSNNIHKNLKDYQLALLKKTDNKFYRSIYHKIDRDIRMIALKGSRGTDKTILIVTGK